MIAVMPFVVRDNRGAVEWSVRSYIHCDEWAHRSLSSNRRSVRVVNVIGRDRFRRKELLVWWRKTKCH
jgi:hypothetical protein